MTQGRCSELKVVPLCF